MNPMSIMAQAEKLGIPELQRSIQDGVVPAFIGVPLLQEKVKRQKQMQMGMATQQPKRPSVAEQVGQEAQQATIADIMKAQALRMQGEMGQTGGISDSLPKPAQAEESYAKGGPIAFAERGLVPGETMAEQLQRLLDEQRAADYGWSEEAAKAYEPKYYQTPEEARASMSRRSLAPAEQPMSLEDLQQAQARAKAQTGLGIRSGETIEIPPYREPVNIRPTQPSTNLVTTGPRGLYGEPTAPSANIAPYAYEGDILGSTRPSVRPVSGLLPDYSPVIEGRSFVHPTATPKADMEAAKAYYAENIGKRPMNAGQAMEQELASKRAAVKAAEDLQLNRAGKIAQFEGAGARLGSPLGADAQLVQKLSMPGVTGYDYKDPAMRSRLQSLFGMEHIKEAGPDAYVGASERVAPKAPIAQAQTPISPATLSTPAMQGGIDQRSTAERMQLRGVPKASFDFANPNQVATDVLANPARVNTDPDLWKWATEYRAQHPQQRLSAPAPTQTPYAQAAVPATQTQPAQEEEKDQSLADYMKQYRDVTGENKGIDALRGRLSEREARLAKEEERAPWMALMQAGLATMAGTSPNALTNVGQGGVAGLQAYTRSMNKLEDAKDKSFDIQTKLEEAQRGEVLAAAKYGLDSVQADKKAKATDKLEQKKLDAQMDVAKLRDATDRLQISASVNNAANSLGMRQKELEGSENYLRTQYANLYDKAQNETDPNKKAQFENQLKGLEKSISLGSSRANQTLTPSTVLNSYDERIKGLLTQLSNPALSSKDRLALQNEINGYKKAANDIMKQHGYGIDVGAGLPTTETTPGLQIGTKKNGYTYLGGNPNSESSWRKD